jgi:nucleoid DNA-binding protein
MFTKEEIEKQVNDKRPLKPISKRRIKAPTPPSKLVRLVAKETGFTIVAVDEVITSLMLVIQKRILDKKEVTLQGIGTLSPVLKKAQRATDFNRYNDKAMGSLCIKPRFEMKFFINEVIDRAVKDVEVSAEEVENMFAEK